MLKIGVVLPTHPPRSAKGFTQRAIQSVLQQDEPAFALCVYNDVERRGASYARQQALEMNRCEWTAFLDSDDYFANNHLEVLSQYQRDTNADYVYTWFWMNGGADPFPETHRTLPWNNAEPRQTTITVMVRTELAREVGFWDVTDEHTFPDGLRVGEDYHFTLGCLNLGAKIFHVPEVRTWYWSHHGANTSGRPDRGDAWA